MMPSHVKGSLEAEVQKLIFGIPELDEAVHKAIGKRMLVLVKQLTPVSERDPLDPHHRPGRLKRSWRLKKAGATTVLYTAVPYAKFVEYDTAPHIIEAKRKKALRFHVDGDTVFAARVMHPGTTGAFMLTKTVATVSREITTIGEREMRKWARKAGF